MNPVDTTIPVATHQTTAAPQLAEQQPVKEADSLVSRLTRGAESLWDRFWFSPADPIVLGMVRIFAGLMLLYTHIVWGLQLEQFFGRTPLLDAETMLLVRGPEWPSFWWFVSPEWVPIVHWGCLGVLLLFLVGKWTRVTSFLTFVIAVSYANRAYFATFGLDQINTMLALYLTIGASGDALSVDQWLRNRREKAASQREGKSTCFSSRWAAAPSISANLGLRLIQVHMCIVYFFAGVSKMQGPAWWSGDAMWLAFALYAYQTIDMTWIARYPSIAWVLTMSTIFWESTFAVFIWIRETRWMVLVMSIAVHVGIGACLGMWTFGLVMLIGCSSFLSASFVRRLLRPVIGGSS